jgi:hypothetical protein
VLTVLPKAQGQELGCARHFENRRSALKHLVTIGPPSMCALFVGSGTATLIMAQYGPTSQRLDRINATFRGSVRCRFGLRTDTVADGVGRLSCYHSSSSVQTRSRPSGATASHQTGPTYYCRPNLAAPGIRQAARHVCFALIFQFWNALPPAAFVLLEGS